MSLIVKTEDEYEDLLGLWSDLESGLGLLLSHPDSVQELRQRIEQYDHWLQDLLIHDTDVGLYLLFQLAIISPVGYSASHSLVCAVLCHLISIENSLPEAERNSLVRAALTMNIAMTALQDELAIQTQKPNGEQQKAIRTHADDGSRMLARLGINDELWLETIRLHHQDDPDDADLSAMTPAHRLAHILHVVDRYAAMISPRQSREGRSAAESAQSIMHSRVPPDRSVGQTLVRIVGVYPPGTFVVLDNQELAAVTRRSSALNMPDVGIVVDAKGVLVRPPRLHRTATGSPVIRSALPAAALQERINHHLILQLGSQSA
jgi:HD-GYP domain-containing protein (c-di-GMP phosphodiesterase class II)